MDVTRHHLSSDCSQAFEPVNLLPSCMRVMTIPDRSNTISTVASSIIPKVAVTLGTTGLVRTSQEQRRVILSEFECSGESAAVFA